MMKPDIHSQIEPCSVWVRTDSGIAAMAARDHGGRAGRVSLFWPARPDPRPFFEGFAVLSPQAAPDTARPEITCGHRGTGETIVYRPHWTTDRFEWIRFALVADDDDAPLFSLRLDLDGARRPRPAADSGSLTLLGSRLLPLRRPIAALIDLSMTGRPAAYPTSQLLGDLMTTIKAASRAAASPAPTPSLEAA